MNSNENFLLNFVIKLRSSKLEFFEAILKCLIQIFDLEFFFEGKILVQNCLVQKLRFVVLLQKLWKNNNKIQIFR